MAVKHALLGILAQSPRHGYDLKREFDDRLGDFWSLNFGQIYSTLDRLRADGLVEYDPVSQEEKADRKVYRITESGRAEFNDWRTSALKVEPRTLRDELFLRILFMDDNEIDAIRRLIQAQQNAYLSQMMQLTNRKFEIEQTLRRAAQKGLGAEEQKRLDRDALIRNVLLDAALFHAEADIRWLRHCEARLSEMVSR